jgi:predicted phosphoribosyltransferase
MGRILADALGGELDVVLVHKLGAPDNPQLAIGSVDEAGHIYLGEYVQELGISTDYIATEKEHQLAILRHRRAQYTPVRPPLSPAGRVAIIVDDGVATGASMIAALRAVRAKNPAKLIAAMAVAPPETVRLMEEEADEVVCLSTPEYFSAVGQFFADFSQVSEEQVIAALQPSRAPVPAQK